MLPATINIFEKAARKAGKILIRDFGEIENLQIQSKNVGDFVTSADLKIEKSLLETLKYYYPDANYITEESGHIKGNGETIVIRSISVKEVQGNVGKPTNMDATNFPYTSVLPDQSFLAGENSSYGFGSFDGTNDIITTSAVNTDYKSFSAWVKPTSTISKTSGGEAIANFGSDGYGIIWIGAWSGALDNELISIYNGGAYRTHMQTTENKTFPNDSWTHIALVWDGSKYQMYFNGQPQTTVTYNNVDSEGVVTTTGLHTTLQSNNA